MASTGGAEADEQSAGRELRAEAGPSGLWPVLTGSPEDASVLAEMVAFNCKDGHTFERTLERASAADEFLVPLDVVTEKPLPEVGIALLPIDEGWKATAILPWGNYNENPAPPVHTAVLRDWSLRYGAEPVSLTGDVLELSVSRPPATDQAALALAREQYSYAPDIVQQGVGDVETLAALLKNGHAWYFWWD